MVIKIKIGFHILYVCIFMMLFLEAGHLNNRHVHLFTSFLTTSFSIVSRHKSCAPIETETHYHFILFIYPYYLNDKTIFLKILMKGRFFGMLRKYYDISAEMLKK